MRKTGRDPKKLRAGLADGLFRAVDSDGNGACDIEELGSAFSVLCSGSRDDRCMAAFEMWDEDGDGYLDVDEMAKLLTSVYKVLYASDPKVAKEMGVSPEELGRITAQDAISQLDQDGDGRLSFSEFRAWYSKPPAAKTSASASQADWVSLEETRRLTGLGRFNPAVVMEAFAVIADEDVCLLLFFVLFVSNLTFETINKLGHGFAQGLCRNSKALGAPRFVCC